MTTYSLAAMAYVKTTKHAHCVDDDQCDFMDAFTAGVEAQEEECTTRGHFGAPVPAPVLLTAGDPRWRDGAKIRGEWADGSACEGWLQSLPVLPGAWFIKHGGIGRSVNVAQVTVWLLAAAPDPDADAVAALEAASYMAWPNLRAEDKVDSDTDWTRAMLVTLRKAGWDITRKSADS